MNQPLSRRDWTDTAAKTLAEDPVLFAGGANNDFHVVYARLVSNQLLLGQERPVVSRLLRDHPYALFVFSNAAQDRWHFLNVKYDEKSKVRSGNNELLLGARISSFLPSQQHRPLSRRLDSCCPSLL